MWVAVVGLALSACGPQGESGSPGAAGSLTVTLAWNEPTSRTDGSALTNLAGYEVHFGTTSRTDPSFSGYSHVLDVSTTAQCSSGSCTCAVTVPTPGTWYFGVTAYDANHLESALSNEASKTFNP